MFAAAIPLLNLKTGIEVTPPAYAIPSSVTAAQVVGRMGMGWNLGNTFDAYHSSNPSGLAFGFGSYTSGSVSQLETAWLGGSANVVTRDLIRAVNAAGFDTIRIPVTWHKAMNNSANSAGPNWTIRTDWMNRIQTVVDWAYNEGMFVILNTHHDEFLLRHGTSDMSQTNQVLTAWWTQIGTRFRDYSERLIFEGINEPRHRTASWGNTSPGGHNWCWAGTTNSNSFNAVNQMNQTFVDAVRATGGNNRNRILMVPTYAAQSTATPLAQFRRPTDSGDRLILSIHAYEPVRFTGISGVENSFAAADITGFMDRVQTRARALNMPVVLGEWGAVASPSGSTRENNRLSYVERYSREAASRGFVPVWWDNGSTTTTASVEGGFGLFDRRGGRVASSQHQAIITAMIRGFEAGGGRRGNTGGTPAPTTTMSLSSSSNHTLPAAAVGYSGSDFVLARSVSNTGANPTGDVTVTLSGTGAGNFVQRPAGGSWTGSAITLNSMNATSGARGFEIRPQSGLTAGTYSVTVTLTAPNVALSASSHSFTVTFTVGAATPMTTIGLTSTSNHTFPSAPLGYGTQAHLSRAVTNTGSSATGEITVALSGTNATAFRLRAEGGGNDAWVGGSLTLPSMNATSGNRGFEVRPAGSLPVGTHTATVTVSAPTASNTRTFTVTFVVTSAQQQQTFGISLSQTSTLTFPGATAGYGEQTWIPITVTNTGNQPTGALTIGIPDGFSASGTSGFANGIAAGETRVFEVRPSRGLDAGTHTGTFTVSGGSNITARNFGVRFVVGTAALTGSATISGDNAIGGTLTVNTANVGGTGTISRQWRADGVAISGATGETFTITPAQAGRVISVVVTRAGFTGGITVTAEQSVPFTIAGAVSGSAAGDSIAISADRGRAGDSVTVTYTLSSGGANSMLSFTGATGLNAVTAPGTGTLTYTVTAADAVNGVITVSALFTHTDLALRTLTFDYNSLTAPFGTAIPANTATISAGAGAITFTSSNPAVATVAADGAMTIVGVGTTTITATVAADATHAAATGSYTLTITAVGQTAPTGLTAVNQSAAGVNNGAISGATSAMEFRLSTDVVYTAATETSVINLAPGEYHVRFAATETQEASPHTVVIILAYGDEGEAPPVVRETLLLNCECCGEFKIQVSITRLTTVNEEARERSVLTRFSGAKRDADGRLIAATKSLTRERVNLDTGAVSNEQMCFNTGAWIVLETPPAAE
jgi:endoglucanase